MNLKILPFEIKEKNPKDLDNVKEYSTLADLMKEQGISTDLADTGIRNVNWIYPTTIAWSMKISKFKKKFKTF